MLTLMWIAVSDYFGCRRVHNDLGVDPEVPNAQRLHQSCPLSDLMFELCGPSILSAILGNTSASADDQPQL